jgi:hypothetical protein
VLSEHALGEGSPAKSLILLREHDLLFFTGSSLSTGLRSLLARRRRFDLILISTFLGSGFRWGSGSGFRRVSGCRRLQRTANWSVERCGPQRLGPIAWEAFDEIGERIERHRAGSIEDSL